MKKLVLAVAILTSSSAFAHFKIGTYKGEDEAGQECAISLKSVAFIDGQKHPLAERVGAEVNGEAWELQHAPQIDKLAGKVLPEHSVLSGVKGIKSADFVGAKAVVFTMDETPAVNGPVDFIYIEHDYIDETKNKKVVCSKLVFQ